jgi:hypothetical protein
MTTPRAASPSFLVAMASYATSLGADISLHTADPGEGGGAEIADAAYSRQPTTWGTPTMIGGNAESLGSDVTFILPPSTVATHYGVWDGGNYQYGAPLSPPITISSSGPGTAIVTPVYQEQPG